MKLTPSHKTEAQKRLIAIAALALLWFILMQLAHYPNFIEHYYSQKLYLFICFILHPVFNLFPFSLGDILYLLLIGYGIYAVIHLVRLSVKKKFKQAGLYCMGLVIGIQAAGIIFYLFWGMNYFRPAAAERLHLDDTTYTLNDITKVTSLLIDSANHYRSEVTAADLKQPNADIYQAARQAVNELSAKSVNYYTYKADIKPSLLTPLLNYIGTSGYYNPFTGEAQINYQMPVFLRPFVACHEMSHQMGYGAEDEANFVGFIAAVNSRNHLLKYSAYFLGMQEFMHTLHYRDSIAFKQLKLKISKSVHLDLKTDRDYWISFENKAGVLSSILYDGFLKANNQPQGLKTYNQMVKLVMAMYKTQGRLSNSADQKVIKLPRPG